MRSSIWRTASAGLTAAVGEPGEEHAHAHQRERGGEAEHDRHHDQRQHQQAEHAEVVARQVRVDRLPHGVRISTGITISAMIVKPNQQLLADCILAPCCGVEPDVLVYVDHLLQLLDVDFLDVLLARGPVALLEADDAADDLDDALRQQEGAGDRDDGLERIDRRAVGGDVGMLVDAPRNRRRRSTRRR